MRRRILGEFVKVGEKLGKMVAWGLNTVYLGAVVEGDGVLGGGSEVKISSYDIERTGGVRDKGTNGAEGGGPTRRLPRGDEMEVSNAKLAKRSGDRGNENAARRRGGDGNAGEAGENALGDNGSNGASYAGSG